MSEKQPKKTKSGRGGARVGGGRPKGSTNKVDVKELSASFEARAGQSFEDFVNDQMLAAAHSGDKELTAKYILGLAKYFIHEKTKNLDVTSNGETVQGAFTFVQTELPEWSKPKE